MENVPFNIQRIVYVDECCLPDLLCSKTKYMIYPDGKMIVEGYRRFSRKREYREEYMLPVDTVLKFYYRVYDCARNAIGHAGYEDDHEGMLTIRYSYGHEEIMDRGLHSAKESIRSIVSEFVERLEQIRENPN